MLWEISACVETLFGEGDASLNERIGRAANAGVPAVEFWGWRRRDLHELRHAAAEAGVAVACFLCDPTLPLVDRSVHRAFLDGLRASTEVAHDLGDAALIVVAGNQHETVDRRSQRTALLDVLQSAAAVAEQARITLLLEPLNTRIDHVGAFLASTEDGLDLVEEVGSSRLRLLYDIYHSATMGESPVEVLNGRTDLVGHVHVADSPGRHEPGTGTIDWKAALALLSRLGYRGRIGLEYRPLQDTASSLAYLRGVVADLSEGGYPAR